MALSFSCRFSEYLLQLPFQYDGRSQFATYAPKTELRNSHYVCVPVVPAGLDRPNHGVLMPPLPPPVVIPPFTPQQLNNAAAVALERIRQRLEFVASLFANNVIVAVSTVQ